MTHSVTAPLLENRDLGNGNFLAIFDAPEIAADTRPAHFVMLRVRDATDPLLGRPYSVARVGRGPKGATVDILYKAIGRGTELLSRLAPGVDGRAVARYRIDRIQAQADEAANGQIMEWEIYPNNDWEREQWLKLPQNSGEV